MPKIVDESERQNEIAEAAVSVFAENGFSETNVQQIADEADISKGSIYLYFDSKTDILYHIFNNFEKALHEAFDRVFSNNESPNQKLESLLSDLTTLVELNRPTITVLFDFWSHSLHSSEESHIDFESFYSRLRERLMELLNEGAQDGSFRSDWEDELPSIIIGLFEGQLIQWLVDPSSPPIEDVKDSGLKLIRNGLLEP